MSADYAAELLLYCIGDGAQRSIGVLPEGVGGAPLSLLRESRLSALVSPLPSRQLLAKPAVHDLLAFERTIASLHACCDVLPARFGCVLQGEGELRAHLREQEATYLSALRRTAGCVEMGVRLELPRSSPEPAPTAPAVAGGAVYLRMRQAQYKRAEADQEMLHQRGEALRDAFADLCSDVRVSRGSDVPAVAVTVSFLVPRNAIEAFRARFAERRQATGERLFLLGPWPPFSFGTTEGVAESEVRSSPSAG